MEAFPEFINRIRLGVGYPHAIAKRKCGARPNLYIFVIRFKHNKSGAIKSFLSQNFLNIFDASKWQNYLLHLWDNSSLTMVKIDELIEMSLSEHGVTISSDSH